jgi:hypothetical protein
VRARRGDEKEVKESERERRKVEKEEGEGWLDF